MNSGIKCYLDLLGCLDLFRHRKKTGKSVLFLYNTKNTLLPVEHSCYDSCILDLMKQSTESFGFVQRMMKKEW